MKNYVYESPSIELTKIAVEQGIATSGADSVNGIAIDSWSGDDTQTINF